MICANPESSNHQPIKDERNLLEIMTGINSYFSFSTKLPWTDKITIWYTD